MSQVCQYKYFGNERFCLETAKMEFVGFMWILDSLFWISDFGFSGSWFWILDLEIWSLVVTVVKAAALPKGGVDLPKGERVA